MKIGLIIIGLLISNILFGQQCAYDNYYLFVVNVHNTNSAINLPNLKMYLVDENETPIKATVSYLEKKAWKERSDTLFFWENEKKQKKPIERPIFLQKYYNIGNYYVVVFRLDLLNIKDPLTHPIFNLKIESENGDTKHQKQIIYLPLAKAVTICNNNVLNDTKNLAIVKTLDGKTFKPIDIELGKLENNITGERNYEFNELQYTIRFDYSHNENDIIGTTQYTINQAKIYDLKNGKLHQTIYIPTHIKSLQKTTDNIVAFADFYNRGLSEAKDFSVKIDSWRDLDFMVVKEKSNYYIFDTTTKKYQLDDELSKYSNVFYDDALKKMRRYEYKMTSTSRIVYTYQLNDNIWILVNREETILKPIVSKIKFDPKACIFIKEKYHTLPLQAFINNNATKIITDTFWLYNACDETVFIAKIESANKDYFYINKTIAPKKYEPLIFKGVLKHSVDNLSTFQYSCSITLSDGHLIPFGITVNILSNGMEVFYNKDSSINYSMAKNKVFTDVIFAYPNGQLKAKGLVLNSDTALKVGVWQYFNKTGLAYNQVIYSKEIGLKALNDIYYTDKPFFNVKVFENGTWKTPITNYKNFQQHIFASDKTDSILVYNDSLSFCFKLEYNTIPVYFTKLFYLVKPTENTLKLNGYNIPFNLHKDSYAFLLNYYKIYTKNRTTEQLVDSIYNGYIKKFPKLKKIYLNKYQNAINLQHLNSAEYKQIMNLIKKDNLIHTASNTFSMYNNDIQTFCDNLLIVQINPSEIEAFKMQIGLLNFEYIGPEASAPYHSIRYKNKILDEHFFNAFKIISNLQYVLSANLNTYHVAEPEVEVMRK